MQHLELSRHGEGGLVTVALVGGDDPWSDRAPTWAPSRQRVVETHIAALMECFAAMVSAAAQRRGYPVRLDLDTLVEVAQNLAPIITTTPPAYGPEAERASGPVTSLD